MALALYTFGVFIERSEHPANDGFHEINDPILALVDRTPGLIARSGYADEDGPDSWGPETYPEFYVERGDGWSPATLSLWEDLEAVFAFTYFGLHAQALARGREWFERPKWPPLCLWWHDGDRRPTWVEGVARHKRLHELGPTPEAFTFKEPFDRTENKARLDKQRLNLWREKAGTSAPA